MEIFQKSMDSLKLSMKDFHAQVYLVEVI